MLETSPEMHARRSQRPARSRIRPLDPRAVAAQSIFIPFIIAFLRCCMTVSGLVFSFLHFVPIPFADMGADLVAMTIVLITAFTIFYYLSFGECTIRFL